MNISYEMVAGAFLSKVTEFEFIQIPEENRTAIIDGYMKMSAASFRKVCRYKLILDDTLRIIADDIHPEDVDEILNILSEGMLVQWMKPYLYKQELLENALNTNDFSGYSPANLLMRVGEAYEKIQKDYIQMVREYSYNHGDLSKLHLSHANWYRPFP